MPNLGAEPCQRRASPAPASGVAPTVQCSPFGLRASCLPQIPCSAFGLRAEWREADAGRRGWRR
jgi:hypothetical protein